MGSVFAEGEVSSNEQVRAYTVPELLSAAGWDNADFVKADIEGAEFEVFSDPSAQRWIAETACISVETHDRFKPGAAAAVESAIPPDLFDRNRSGEFTVYVRRQLPPLGPLSAAQPLLLGAGSPRPITFDLVNVPQPEWGFHAIDDETFSSIRTRPEVGRPKCG